MPFTFSHPSVVLPLACLPKKYRSVTGLIIGSLAPDFEKFIRMRAHDEFSHTWKSIFYFNLPLSILLAFLFHLIVRDPLIDNLPLFLKARLQKFKKFAWVRFFKEHPFLFLTSAFIGIVSHIVWDSFTHYDGKFALLIPVLSERIRILNHSWLLSVLLDRISSVLGGIVIMLVIMKLPKKYMLYKEDFKSQSYWIIISLVTLIILLIRFSSGFDIEHNLWDFIFSFISAGLLAFLFSSAIIRLTHNKLE